MAHPRHKDFQAKCRIWINGEEGMYLGVGRIELLKKVGETGSISKAAKSMKMSYRRAWQMIDSMNQSARSPLVVRASGGINGGGTTLTAAGEQAIALFNTLNERCQTFASEEWKKLNESPHGQEA